ncbi:MAG: hypothetical protein M0Z87_08110 [Actinomycetota bacterium]|nr:hypothetical protein [Actinomycetota bacterium]
MCNTRRRGTDLPGPVAGSGWRGCDPRLRSVEAVAAYDGTTAVTAARWLLSVGVQLQPGRKPRDG